MSEHGKRLCREKTQRRPESEISSLNAPQFGKPFQLNLLTIAIAPVSPQQKALELFERRRKILDICMI
jgi:hypothetical protein